MTDPKSPAEIMKDRDNATYARLQHCSVLTYCWAIENGHRTWADLDPPSIVALQESANILLDNPEAFGQHYLATLTRILFERCAKTISEVEEKVAKQTTKTFPIYSGNHLNSGQPWNA